MTRPKTTRPKPRQAKRQSRGEAKTATAAPEATRAKKDPAEVREQRGRWIESFLEERSHAQSAPLAGVPQLAVATGLARLEVNDVNRRLALEYAKLKPALEGALGVARTIEGLVNPYPVLRLTRGPAEPQSKGGQQDPKREAPTPRELVDTLTAALRETEDTLFLFSQSRNPGGEPPKPATLAVEELYRLKGHGMKMRSPAKMIEDLNLEDGLTSYDLRNRVKQRRRRKTGK